LPETPFCERVESMGDINHVLVRDGRLLICGILAVPDEEPAGCLLEWDGAEWSAWTWKEHDPPYRMIDHEGRLVTCGAFDILGWIWIGACFVMEWTGKRWRDLGRRPDLAVTAMTIHKGELIAAGSFRCLGIRTVMRIARWDGASWLPLESGIESEYFMPVRAAVSLGGDLYVGGSFHKAGGKPSTSIACFRG